MGIELPRCSMPHTASGPACVEPAAFRMRLIRTDLVAYACQLHLYKVDTLCEQVAGYTEDEVVIDRLSWAPMRRGHDIRTPRPTDAAGARARAGVL